MLKRIVDVLLVAFSIPISLPLVVVTAFLVKCSSPGPILFWSKRIGMNNKLFEMPKFRSMHVGSPQLATHLLNQQDDASTYLTSLGRFIRKTSLDELPQLWSVFIGEMTIVGPRPALFNQGDLVQLRTAAGVHALKPGITGWAQVNGRDEIPIEAKVILDKYYLEHHSLLLDGYIIFLTVLKVIKRDGVLH